MRYDSGRYSQDDGGCSLNGKTEGAERRIVITAEPETTEATAVMPKPVVARDKPVQQRAGGGIFGHHVLEFQHERQRGQDRDAAQLEVLDLKDFGLLSTVNRRKPWRNKTSKCSQDKV